MRYHHPHGGTATDQPIGRDVQTGECAATLRKAGLHVSVAAMLDIPPSALASCSGTIARKPEMTLEIAGRYGLLAVLSGLGVAFAADAWERAQTRRQALRRCPRGYGFSGCDEGRAAGIAPIYRSEVGFWDRLDGYGDGIGCEAHSNCS